MAASGEENLLRKKIKMKKPIVISIAILLVLYLMSYGWFRQTQTEIWGKNGKPYVIFPEGNLFLYYFFRPISIIDGKLTGIGFHIGQHR